MSNIDFRVSDCIGCERAAVRLAASLPETGMLDEGIIKENANSQGVFKRRTGAHGNFVKNVAIWTKCLERMESNESAYEGAY